MAMWLISMNVLAILASLYPWGLGAPADPIAPAPEGIHPEWYFMSQFQILKVFGRWFPGMTGEVLGILFFTAGIVLWSLIPFYDKDNTNARRARHASWFGLAALTALIVLTIWGYAEI